MDEPSERTASRKRKFDIYNTFDLSDVPHIGLALGAAPNVAATTSHRSRGYLRPVPDLDRRNLRFSDRDLNDIFKANASTINDLHRRQQKSTRDWRMIPDDITDDTPGSVSPGGLNVFRVLFKLRLDTTSDKSRQSLGPDMDHFLTGQLIALVSDSNSEDGQWAFGCCTWHFAQKLLQSSA